MQEDLNLQQRRCENFKSRVVIFIHSCLLRIAKGLYFSCLVFGKLQNVSPSGERLRRRS